MNKDNIEGGVRKTAGQFVESVSRAFQDKYDQAAGAAQNAYGQARTS